jgi:hypothetical protein
VKWQKGNWFAVTKKRRKALATQQTTAQVQNEYTSHIAHTLCKTKPRQEKRGRPRPQERGKMSWGERSCTHSAVWEHYCKEEDCNVNCSHYDWDGITKPDSAKKIATQKTIPHPSGLNRAQRRARGIK